MKNLMIFPYHRDVDIILRNQEILKDRKIVDIISFPEDQERLNELKEKHMVDSEKDSHSDTVLILNPEKGNRLETYSEKIEELEKSGMSIWYLDPNNKFSVKNVHNYDENKYSKKRYSVPVPIIAILGQGSCCSKFETLLLTKKTIDEMGYKSISVSANDLGSLFGCYSYPDILGKNNVGLEEKIFSINHYIYDLYKLENPEVILLEMPGGIMKMGEKNENHFSELAYVIANAVEIDSGIMNLYFTKSYDDDYINEIRKYCYYKYEIVIDLLISARQRTEYSMEMRDWEYYFLDDYVINRIQKANEKDQSIINISETANCIQRIRNMIDEFTTIYERV